MKKEHFIKWLKSKRLYSKFAREIANRGVNTVDGVIEISLEFDDLEFVVYGGFNWKSSEDGSYFWSNVASEWMKERELILKNIIDE